MSTLLHQSRSVHPQQPHYSDYSKPPPATAANPASYRQNNLPLNPSSRILPSAYRPKPSSTADSRPSSSQHPPQNHPSYVTVKSESSDPAMSQSRKADWAEFYKNGVPKEVIVIDDSSPEPEPVQKSVSVKGNGAGVDSSSRVPSSRQQQQHSTVVHPNKKQRTGATTSYDPVYNRSRKVQETQPDDDATSSSASRRRTNSGQYSTAPTSLTSVSSAGQRVTKVDDIRAGQKRKRPTNRGSAHEEEEEQSPEPRITAQQQHHSWSNYYPPPKPPIKAQDVYVNVVRDRTSASSHKIDDDDGHYIVNANSNLTDRYTISRLLGQGTFGKVVEAFDRKKKTKCAVKIIRAVPKYRDASRIELRVLSTLKANDQHNRNRCIHLRDCFDYRNHICIVTDLLGSSVFDFLKANQFTPFPSSHIQSFARQLLTSVAFLHDLNLIHTDLKPENILLVSGQYQTFTYNKNVPSSSKSQQRNAKFRKVLLEPEIRLIDFGSATFDDEYHSSVVSTRHYRAPEIILNLGWSFPCDIWSIGCILVEFFTGDALFQTHDNLEHLAMMEAVCEERFDRDIITQVRTNNRTSKSTNNAASYFRPRAYALDYPNHDTPRTSRKFVKAMKRLDETIPAIENQPNYEFNSSFLDLLKKIFVYDPKKRITAKQALNHPWFTHTISDDGTEAYKIKLRQGSHGYK